MPDPAPAERDSVQVTDRDLSDVLGRLLDGTTPGPWRPQERERQASGHPLEPVTKGYYVVDERGDVNVAQSGADDVALLAVAPVLAQVLLDVLSHHTRRNGDWRLDYRVVCSECSEQRHEPYYNEVRTWRVPADWPCPTVRKITDALERAGLLGGQDG